MMIAFRVDASVQIGTGHFMRCLTLAGSLQEAGARCEFFCRHALDHLRAMAIGAGHGFHSLDAVVFEDAGDTAHSSWLHTTQSIDAAQTLEAMSVTHWNWIVVDHYALDASWESAVGKSGEVFVIDDLADRAHECRMLLDQNLYPDADSRYQEKVPPSCRLLLGPAYALLRREFTDRRAAVRQRTGPVRRILIQMGGIDADNQTEKAIEAVASLRDSRAVDVVVGKQHPSLDKLKALCRRHGYTLHVQFAGLAALVAAADLAIGAAGSSSWERCCLGLPTICIAQAPNQAAIAKGLEAHGAVIYLGDAASVSVALLTQAVEAIVARPERLAAASAAASRLVDGRGTERVSQRLMEAV